MLAKGEGVEDEADSKALAGAGKVVGVPDAVNMPGEVADVVIEAPEAALEPGAVPCWTAAMVRRVQITEPLVLM